jgi:hypothetical protein
VTVELLPITNVGANRQMYFEKVETMVVAEDSENEIFKSCDGGEDNEMLMALTYVPFGIANVCRTFTLIVLQQAVRTRIDASNMLE